MTPEFSQKLIELLNDKKAEDVRYIPLEDALFEAFVVATGTSRRHLLTLAEMLQKHLKAQKIYANIEGVEKGEWILLDAGDVVIHLFTEEARAHYQIEELAGKTQEILTP